MGKTPSRWLLHIAVVLGLLAGHAAWAQSSSSSSSSSRPATLPPLQSGFIECALQGQTCNFTGTRTVLTDSCFEYTCWSSKVVTTAPVVCRGYLMGASARCAYSVGELGATAPFPGLTASASTQSGTGRTAAKAIDGDADTRWEASNSTAGSWLRVSGSEPIYLSKIEVFEVGSKIRGYRVEYLQGSVWTPLTEGSVVGPHLVIDMAGRTPVLTTAVRIITTGAAAGQPSISELVVLGNRPRPASSSSSSSSNGMCGPSTGSCCNGVPCDMTCQNPANWNKPPCNTSSSSSSASPAASTLKSSGLRTSPVAALARTAGPVSRDAANRVDMTLANSLSRAAMTVRPV
ncbi:discoidin domain-containing protein [Uliginosibacterium sp. H3]|uniref:Discoidin domain-containing protein n=1 Tax=Uliginosibacterium silvisoli TaxID=3114758 RepID=A0ABU6K849_9RHOO|nr:discoidin domain-containing protein [Uliginosibacterium sp. H3]